MGGPKSERGPASLDDRTRRLAVTTVAAAGIGWWPSFTLGAYGVVFFEQQLVLWVVATSVFLVAASALRSRVFDRPAWWTLLLPSLWLGVSIVLPSGGTTLAYTALFWFGVLVTGVGFPVMAALLVRLVIPGTQRLDRDQGTVVIGIVAVVMAASYVLGVLHPRILTCEDFTISGNFAPPTCTPGEGTTVR
ncbi:MAG: hypothetical protein WCA29_12110 [Jiangellales bacterium]